MTIDRRMLLGGALGAPLLAGVADAQGRSRHIPLWPGQPPGATAQLPRYKKEERPLPGRTEIWVTGVAAPEIEMFLPITSNGVGLLVIPGGGYEFLAYSNEGTDLAELFAKLGYTVAVLAYRLPAEGWLRQADVPLQDAQRAIRLLRSLAPQLTHVGAIGSSAGGHLAASLATAYDERVYAPVDAADKRPARPDFVGLNYAVTTLDLPDTHLGSREHLLGVGATTAEVARRSPVRHVDARTPPSFLLHCFDDTVVPVACSRAWMDACRAARVPVEAHLFEAGGHGFGVALPMRNPGSLWPELFRRWIGQHIARS